MDYPSARAPRTHNGLCEGLDGQHQLRAGLNRLQDPEPGQTKHHLGNADSVTQVGDPTFIDCDLDSCNDDPGP